MKRPLLLLLALAVACTKSEAPPPSAPRPPLLLVTLDTTRADAIGPDTPAFNELAKRGRVFRWAYATTPQTLPSHASMLTGLYPAAHGVHENARRLGSNHALVAEKLREAGYRTAAFVSAVPLARQFGLDRGFELYDDEFGKRAERPASETTDRALQWLAQQSGPVFLWVHYFEPHYPYEPPAELRAQYANAPYRGEVAAMDRQLGRLLDAFGKKFPAAAIVIAGDHGEGLGEHGESQHGNLLYNSTMHVPLVVAGPGVAAGTSDAPVSTRRIFHTLLDWGGVASKQSLRGASSEVVVGEAMIPFLQFGWQPQVMTVEGRTKAIHAGAIEIYDVVADPRETREINAELSREMRKTLREYPIPSPDAPPAATNISEEEQKQLAALGYITSDVRPVVRKDAPRPRDMAHLFDDLDKASGLFVVEEYARAIPVLEKILAADSYNLMAALRIAAAHSALGHDQQALEAFRRAQQIAPNSPDVRNYLALHYARMRDWRNAEPLLARVVAESPERVPALEALAMLREEQGRPDEAFTLRQRVATLKTSNAAELAHLGALAMELGRTDVAIDSLEKARSLEPKAFRNDLELGVLYLAERRFEEARAALDRALTSHPTNAMALFKRAQVSVLLNEPDSQARIALAEKHADAMTRELIGREKLFR